MAEKEKKLLDIDYILGGAGRTSESQTPQVVIPSTPPGFFGPTIDQTSTYQSLGLTPPATITQMPGILPWTLEMISRPGYASAAGGLALARRLQDYPQEYEPFGLDPLLWLFQRGGESNRTVLGDVWQGFLSGLRGDTPASWRDVAVELGVPEEPILPNAPGFLGNITWAGATGFAGDVTLDLLNLIGIGALNRAGRAAQMAGNLPSLRSAQALAGQRDLITFAGRGLSSLPGSAGEAARRAQASVFRGLEYAGQRLTDPSFELLGVPVGEYGKWLVDRLTVYGTGPVRWVRERLRRRESEEYYQTLQAQRQYQQMRRDIIDIANKYDLDPEELNRAIVYEAERKVRLVELETPEQRAVGAVEPDDTILPGAQFLPGTREEFVGSGLVASVVESPRIRYIVKQGETLSDIAKKFNTTVEELATNNSIRDPNLIRAGQSIEVPMPKEAQDILESIRAAQPERLAREWAAGVPTPEFESERIAYLHRELSDELKRSGWKEAGEWLAQNRPILSVRHGAQKARRIAPDAYQREINQAAIEGRTAWAWVDEDGNIVSKETKGARRQVVITDEPQKKPALPRRPLYVEDPAVIEFARERMTIRSVTTAEALRDIRRVGLEERWAVIAESDEHVEELLAQGWRSVQAPRFGGLLKNVYFPEEVADEIDKFVRLMTNQQTRSAVADSILGALRWWKNQTLSPFPEYHALNLSTGIIKNYYAGLLPGDPAYLYGQLFAVLRQADSVAMRYGANEQFARALEAAKNATIKTKDGKTYTLRELLDLYEAEGLNRGYIQAFFLDESPTASQLIRGSGFEWRRLNPLSGDSYLISFGRAVGTYLEDNLRSSLFIKKIKEGYSPHEAANFVRTYHFDYSEIPPWLKTARDWVFPFITWAYKNLPNEIATLIQQPGKISSVVDFARMIEAEAGGSERPDLHETPSFLLLPVYVGRDEEGNAKFSNILRMWGMLDVAEAVKDPFAYIMDQLHAFWQEPLEQWLNYDYRFDRPIVPEELEAARRNLVQTGAIGRFSPENIAMYLGANAPSGPFGLPARIEHALQTLRYYTVAQRFFDPDVPTEQAILRTLTGLTTYESNPYYSGPSYFMDWRDAFSYYQNQVQLYERLAHEAELRGDMRAALIYQRQAEELREVAKQYLPLMQQALPRTGGQ